MARALGDRPSHRTQITLSRDEYEQLSQLAAGQGTSMAQIVREALQRYVLDEDTHRVEHMLSIVGIGSSGRKDGSINHDTYIYGP